MCVCACVRVRCGECWVGWGSAEHGQHACSARHERMPCTHMGGQVGGRASSLSPRLHVSLLTISSLFFPTPPLRHPPPHPLCLLRSFCSLSLGSRPYGLTGQRRSRRHCGTAHPLPVPLSGPTGTGQERARRSRGDSSGAGRRKGCHFAARRSARSGHSLFVIRQEREATRPLLAYPARLACCVPPSLASVSTKRSSYSILLLSLQQ